MKLELDKRFKDKAKGRFGKYEFEVGVLQNGPHKKPRSRKAGFKSFSGGPARKTGAGTNGTLNEISKLNRVKKNYLLAPFKKKSSEIIKFSREFFKMCFGKTEPKRAVNFLQAIVRNPILRGDYGPNRATTVKIKGFDRYMIDTGQLFKAIMARVKIKNV